MQFRFRVHNVIWRLRSRLQVWLAYIVHVVTDEWQRWPEVPGVWLHLTGTLHCNMGGSLIFHFVSCFTYTPPFNEHKWLLTCLYAAKLKFLNISCWRFWSHKVLLSFPRRTLLPEHSNNLPLGLPLGLPGKRDSCRFQTSQDRRWWWWLCKGVISYGQNISWICKFFMAIPRC